MAWSSLHYTRRIALFFLLLVMTSIATHSQQRPSATGEPDIRPPSTTQSLVFCPMGDDEFLINPGKVSDKILKETRDVLNAFWDDGECESLITGGIGKGRRACGPLQTFVLRGKDSFHPGEDIPWFKRHPISTFDEKSVSESYPIVDERGEYVKIVYDVLTDKRSWVRLTSEGETLRTGAPICSRAGLAGCSTSVYQGPVDPYYLLGRPTIRVYSSPSTKSSFTTVSNPCFSKTSCDILISTEQKNGFLHICCEANDIHAKPVPLGWIPLRDKKGRYLIWPVGFYC